MTRRTCSLERTRSLTWNAARRSGRRHRGGRGGRGGRLLRENGGMSRAKAEAGDWLSVLGTYRSMKRLEAARRARQRAAEKLAA